MAYGLRFIGHGSENPQQSIPTQSQSRHAEPSLLLEQVEQHSTIAVAIHVGPTCQLGWGLVKVEFKYMIINPRLCGTTYRMQFFYI
jgi:hypothetical protein